MMDIEKKISPANNHPRFKTALLWFSLFAFLSLLVGFVTPGWLCATVKMLAESESTEPVLVYQNYGLWYMTQCDLFYNGDVCDTRLYSLINAMVRSNIGYAIIGYAERPTLFFDGKGLAFSYPELNGILSMYTIGTIMSLYILYSCYNIRRGNFVVSKFRLLVLIILAFVSASLVSLSVDAFKQKGVKISKKTPSTKYYEVNELRDGLGIYFGGIGAAALSLWFICMIFYLLIQMGCLCAPSESGQQGIEVKPQTHVEDEVSEQLNDNQTR